MYDGIHSFDYDSAWGTRLPRVGTAKVTDLIMYKKYLENQGELTEEQARHILVMYGRHAVSANNNYCLADYLWCADEYEPKDAALCHFQKLLRRDYPEGIDLFWVSW